MIYFHANELSWQLFLTAHAEVLYSCVEQTVQEDLPQEIRFLHAFDRFSSAVKEIVEMPNREIEMLRGFLAQGGGHFLKRARENEFHALTDEEATQIEVLFNEHFGDFRRKAV